MIRAVFTAVSVLLATVLPAAAIDIQQVTSAKGVQGWLVEDHSIPFVALNIAFRGGASVDAPGKRGAVNLMTGLLEEGAGARNATQYAEALEELGASVRFGASADAVTVSARILTENRDKASALIRDALTNPSFDPEAVERVRAQVLAAIQTEQTDPQTIASTTLAGLAWGDHPYATSINGTADSVAALTRDDLMAAQGRVLARDRVIVSAAGDINAADLAQLIDWIVGDLPATASVPLPPKAQLALTGGVTKVDWDSPQSVVSFAQEGLPMSDPDYFAAFVLNHILGNFDSRLMNEIREKRGLTYGVSTMLANQVNGQMWAGGMATDNAKTAEAVAVLRTIWDGMRDGVTDKELADAKTYLTGEYPLRFDGNGNIAGILTGMQMMGMPRDYINTRNTHIEAVTSDDIKRVASRLLDSGKLRFVLVGRPEGI